MKIVCFLREIGLPLNGIGTLMSDENSADVIALLLQQEEALRREMEDRQEMLDKLGEVKRALKGVDNFSVESIGDIAHIMENRKKMRKVHTVMILLGIVIDAIEIGTIVL